MPVTELNAHLKYRNKSGDTTVFYPVIKADHIDGILPITSGGTGIGDMINACVGLGAVPAFTYGIDDILPGSKSDKADGTIHFVYTTENNVWDHVNSIYITIDGVWRLIKDSVYRYVSLGDSIAAGHSINADWAEEYGTGSQYGENGNTSTAIVTDCYTDLIHRELASSKEKVQTTSFAHSGDTVADLITKLTDDVVVNTIKRADLVTICIGANDVLQPAMSHLDEYINTGDLTELATTIDNNLAVLADDTNANSYHALFTRLNEINPNATYVFTTIYNPYKYLWIEEGHNGFFEPILGTIPKMTILGFRVDSLIKDSLLDTSIVKQLFKRVNGLDDWSEKYVTALNDVLKRKISAFQSTNPKFMVADTKAVYDGVPDRVTEAKYHYNDLVSVEFTRGYTVSKMDYGRLWEGSNSATFWGGLATKYASTSGLDINGLASELVDQLIEKVITPDVDPHPESYGHYVMKRSFADVLGWQSLDRYTITYEANGGTGEMAEQTVLGVDGYAAYASIAACAYSPGAEGYYFAKWVDSGGTAYSAGQWVGFTSNLTLDAEWSNIYYIRYDAYSDSTLVSDSNEGDTDYYKLVINDEVKGDFGKFSNDSIYFTAPYGTRVVVEVGDSAKNEQSYVDWDGVKMTDSSNSTSYQFDLTCNVRVRFEWCYYYFGITLHSYWNCHITTV